MFVTMNKILSLNSGVKLSCLRFMGTCFLKENSVFKTNLSVPSQVFVVNNVTPLFCQKRHRSENGIQDNISALQMKKKPLRKKRVLTHTDTIEPGFWKVKALATAEEYSLETLLEALIKQDLYKTTKIFTADKCGSLPHNVLHSVAKYEVEQEPREIYFFREGTVVMWNISDMECDNILQLLKEHEENTYSRNLVKSEIEMLAYTYTEPDKRSHLCNGNIYLTPVNNSMDKYTFSNAISQSVKLGIWEASLNNFADSIEFITEDLKKGRKIKMSRPEVLRKQGELFALRHLINLSSDLLDTPDFYWERDELENLYQQTCSYFSINKRTRVMNEKVNHCMELVELLSSHLSDRHHVRLEWMIIILIMVEVAFETIHYIDRYFGKKDPEVRFLSQ